MSTPTLSSEITSGAWSAPPPPSFADWTPPAPPSEPSEMAADRPPAVRLDAAQAATRESIETWARAHQGDVSDHTWEVTLLSRRRFARPCPTLPTTQAVPCRRARGGPSRGVRPSAS